MRVVGEERIERKGKGCTKWGGRADVDVAKEAEARVSRRRIEFVCAILSNINQHSKLHHHEK